MTDPATVDPAATVLQIVDTVVGDLDRSRPPPRATLHSRLQRDLGLDSLSLSELLVALEQAFAVSLPTSVLSSAETPDDLVRAVVDAGPLTVIRPTPGGAVRPEPAARPAPADLATLVDVLDWHAATHPERVHLWLVDESGAGDPVTYAELRASAGRVAQGLIRSDITPGQSVALMLPTSRAYFDAFLGVLLAGGVPVPIYPPARPSQIGDHLRRHITLLANAQAAALITVPEGRTVARVLRSSVGTLRRVVTVDELAGTDGGEPLPRAAPGDTALLQYTSGSTGQPKGVVLSHAALLASVRAMARGAGVTPDDVCVSWLPLYHDMGLIGSWLTCLSSAVPTVVLSPQSFLARPARWLEAIGAHRGTVTAAPNFAYELCLRRVGDDELPALDLSSLRMALNGAEPVVAGTMERFAERFAPCGLRPGALAPVYGLAECGLGVTFPPPGRGLVVDRVVADVLRSDGRAVQATRGDRDVVRVVSCGSPLPGYEVRIVGPDSRPLPERQEGEVEFRGPSATSGYFRDPDATAALFDGTWLRTGDLGYRASGDLYLTGRSKDLMTVAGRNLHPEQLEAEVGRIPGVRKGCVAVFGVPDPSTGTERLVVLAETHLTDEEELRSLRGRILDTTVDVLDTPAGDVVLAPPGAVLKTSSGKIRRSECAQRYLRGGTATRERPPWWQLVRVGARGLDPGLRDAVRSVPELAYAAWCVVLLAVVGGFLLAVVAVVPRRAWRRRAVRVAARSLLRLSGTTLDVAGTWPAGPGGRCVVVANHASWLDALVLAAWLPPDVTFVAGEVFRRQRVAGYLMHRIGVEFVEGADPGQGVSATERLVEVAAGSSVVIFPEGGLSREPGLRAFHMGAFVVAVDRGLPVFPLALTGTRAMLRPGHRMMRRGRVGLVVGDRLEPPGPGWPGAVALRRLARGVVLAGCGEPDLA